MWLDMELNQAKALLEAAEVGQASGRLKRSPANLEPAMATLRGWISGQQKLEDDSRARRKEGRADEQQGHSG